MAALRAVLSLAGLAAVWWIAVVAFALPDFLLPAPPAVAERLVFLAVHADLWRHAATTLGEVLQGFALGALVGILAGAVFAHSPRAERLATPLVVLIQTAPKIAIAPLLILWLGLGAGPKIVLVAIVTFFPAMAGTLAGIATIPAAYRDLAAVLRLPGWRRFLRIELPFALPPLVAGLRVATTQAMTAAVVAELMGADRGLGYLLSAGQESSDAAGVIGVILILAVVGLLFHEAVRLAEARLVGWHASQRE